MFDTIIKNAKIYDGTGTPHYYGDVAVKNGRIAAIGRHLTGGARMVDATGLCLAPGFIDAHTHDDHHLIEEPSVFFKLEQGVTTVIAGCCGNTCAPISQEYKTDCVRTFSHLASTDFDLDARPDFAAYLNEMDGMNYGPNMLMQIGHSAVRAAVSGYADRPLTPDELEKMKQHVRTAMEAGAFGISFGLIYPPGSYATEEELTEVCKVVAEYGGTFSVHLRNEDDHLQKALAEMIRVAKNSGCRGIMSHQKSEYTWNWGRTKESLAQLQKAVDDGLDIFIDQYPYGACSTGLRSLIPGDIHALGTDKIVETLSTGDGRAIVRKSMEKYYGVEPGGDLDPFVDVIRVTLSPSHPDDDGKMLVDIAAERGITLIDALFDVLRDDRFETLCVMHSMGEEDVEGLMVWRRTMIGSDGLYAPGGKMAHPRCYGTFPRYLGRYARDRGLLPLEEAIRKITAMPAAVYGLGTKGVIKLGMDADLTLFDEKAIIDNADYINFNAKNSGIAKVFVNGAVVVEDNLYNGRLPGRLLRK